MRFYSYFINANHSVTGLNYLKKLITDSNEITSAKLQYSNLIVRLRQHRPSHSLFNIFPEPFEAAGALNLRSSQCIYPMMTLTAMSRRRPGGQGIVFHLTKKTSVSAVCRSRIMSLIVFPLRWVRLTPCPTQPRLYTTFLSPMYPRAGAMSRGTDTGPPHSWVKRISLRAKNYCWDFIGF